MVLKVVLERSGRCVTIVELQFSTHDTETINRRYLIRIISSKDLKPLNSHSLNFSSFSSLIVQNDKTEHFVDSIKRLLRLCNT